MTLRIGIVGWGEIARFHTPHLSACGAVLSGVVLRRTIPLDVRIYDTLKEMLPHVDAVTLTVPNYLHAELCLEAIQAGKPVLVEKPLCIFASELDELEEAMLSLRVPVHLGYRLRCNPILLKLKASLTRPRRIRCLYRLGIDRLAHGKDWTRLQALSGGALFTLGVHALDLCRWLAEARGESLGDLRILAVDEGEGADFPLQVSMAGTLRNRIQVNVETDLRGDQEFLLEVEVEDREGMVRQLDFPLPETNYKEEAQQEYALLMARFIEDARSKRWDAGEAKEIIQTHRDLLRARELMDKWVSS